jgi:hypothetical protein
VEQGAAPAFHPTCRQLIITPLFFFKATQRQFQPSSLGSPFVFSSKQQLNGATNPSTDPSNELTNVNKQTN